MDNPFKKPKFTLPAEGMLDPAKMRADQIAREHKERFERIAKRLLDVVVEEKVKVVELPVIVGMMTGKVNFQIDEAEIEKILNLNKKDDKAQS